MSETDNGGQVKITPEMIAALRQTLDYLKDQEGKSHQSYFWSGWAGQQLRELLAVASKEADA